MKVEKLWNAKCDHCGVENNEEYNHIALYKTEDLDFFVKCDDCCAMTPKFDNPTAAIACWRAGEYTIPTHSELQIYEGCISLMQGLVEDFKEWLEFQNIEVAEDERFRIGISPFKIVNRLFLWHTDHCGAISTWAKIDELEIENCLQKIWFDVKEDEE